MVHSSGSFPIIAPRSKFYQGPFGRLCPDLPPWSPEGFDTEEEIDEHFRNIAKKEMVEAPGKTSSQIAKDKKLRNLIEKKFGSKIPAGYTYFGQFVDHDITFDPASSLMRSNDPSGLLNHRTPRLDLDNVYGKGPTVDPFLYDKDDGDKCLVEKIKNSNLLDLPRSSQGRALIGTCETMRTRSSRSFSWLSC